MSGSKVLAFRKHAPPDPLQEKLRVEDDRRLVRSTGASSLLGFAFAAWAMTLQPAFRPPAPPEPPKITTRTDVPIRIKTPIDYHGKIRDKRPAKRVARNGKQAPKAPVAKTRHPAERPGWLGQNLLTSRDPRRHLGAYDLLDASLKRFDMEKLDELPMLKRTPQSHIAGRRGRVSHEFNVEYSEAGGDCLADCGPGAIPSLPQGRLRGEPVAPAGPRITSIEYARESNARSTAAILAVIRAHAPGLRHEYNGFLKRHPGLEGKLTLHFSIAPGGDVLELAVVSSTTGAPDFDAAIGRQVRSWRFDPVKAIGNDEVTVPLTFSE